MAYDIGYRFCEQTPRSGDVLDLIKNHLDDNGRLICRHCRGTDTCLWFESFAESLDHCGNDLGKKIRCIIRHLSMPALRLWCEEGFLKRRVVDPLYVRILEDCYNILIELPGIGGMVTFGILIALPFTEGHLDEDWTLQTQTYLEKRYSEARDILSKRRDLRLLGMQMERITDEHRAEQPHD